MDSRSKRENELFLSWKNASPDTKAQYETKLVRELHGHARRLVWSKLRGDYPDIAQEAVQKVLEGSDAVAEPEHFATWFHRVVLNLIADELRAIQNYRERTVADMGDVDIVGDSPDSVPLICVREVIEGLTEADLALIQGKLDGYNGTELAKELGISVGALKQRWFKLRRKIRDAHSVGKGN